MSTEIYTDIGQAKRGDRPIIALTSWKSLMTDTYVCLACGYVEEYVRSSDLTEKKEAILSNWKKL